MQYFYEPFLEAFDPELRKQLGVWYTPPEIVKYMVARVDQVLKSDFGRPDGLADPDVYVLDPCCGTGAYLVEVLNTIAATLAEQGGRRPARRPAEAGGHRPRFRLRDSAGPVRRRPLATRPVPPATRHGPGRQDATSGRPST